MACDAQLEAALARLQSVSTNSCGICTSLNLIFLGPLWESEEEPSQTGWDAHPILHDKWSSQSRGRSSGIHLSHLPPWSRFCGGSVTNCLLASQPKPRPRSDLDWDSPDCVWPDTSYR